jgi:hypothetical protein
MTHEARQRPCEPGWHNQLVTPCERTEAAGWLLTQFISFFRCTTTLAKRTPNIYYAPLRVLDTIKILYEIETPFGSKLPHSGWALRVVV